MNQGIADHIRPELVQFFNVGQFSGEQKIGDLNEITIVSKFLNVVAPITKNAVFPVQIGDSGLTGTGVHIATVKGDIAGFP